MSAFVVSRNTIHACVNAFAHRHKQRTGEEMKRPDLDDLGFRLWSMNADAVSQRYSEAPEPVGQYRHVPLYFDPCQQLKALNCLQYQCTEGDIDERALYHQLCGIINETAQEIACGLQAYDKAEWNIDDDRTFPVRIC